jgi:hypothetical protein
MEQNREMHFNKTVRYPAAAIITSSSILLGPLNGADTKNGAMHFRIRWYPQRGRYNYDVRWTLLLFETLSRPPTHTKFKA